MNRTNRRLADINRYIKILSHKILSLGADLNPEHILILGNQKSGTTAIASLLAQHIGGSATLDMPAIWDHVEGILTGNEHLGPFVDRHAHYFSRDVVKEPWLTFMLQELSQIFPRVNYVLILRDPRDNIRSILDRLNLPGNLSINPPGIANLKTGWKEVFNPMLISCEDEHYINLLAERWNTAARVPEEKGSLVQSIVRYEDFLEDKVQFITDLARRLGHQGRFDIKDEIDQQFQPEGKNRGIEWMDYFGKENLEKIEERCGDLMDVFSYTT